MRDQTDDEIDISSFKEIANNYDVLPQEEEWNLLLKVQGYPKTTESRKPMELLIKHNERLVIGIAKRYLRKGLTYQDLIQEGNIGLITGIMKFDINKRYKGRPYKLSTYVTWWIRQAITRGIAKYGRLKRVPINVCAEYTLVQRLYVNFSDEHQGHNPNEYDLAALYEQAMLKEKEEWLSLPKAKREKKKLKLKPKTAKEIAELGGLFLPVGSLDAPNSDDDNLTLLDYLCEEEDRQPEELAQQEMNQDLYDQLMSVLTKEESNFISIMLGLIDSKERDRKSMAAIKKMTPEAVKIKEEGILTKMRQKARELGYVEFPALYKMKQDRSDED